MADNVPVPGSYLVATDQDPATGKHHQKIKLVHGPDDTFTDVTATTRLPVSSKSTFTPKGYQQLTGLGAATGLTVPSGALFALVQVETPVRWRDDGTSPTASVGMPMSAGDQMFYDGDLAAIKIIATGASAIANITYYS